MKKLILGAAMSCSLLFSSQAQVTLTVNPTQTVATAPRSLYGVNFQRALNDGEAANASFKARINDMNPEMIRYHAFEQKVDGHANSWIDFAAQAWRATKIDAVLDNAPVSGDKILITISGWPNWMDTNNDGKLDTDKYTAYANFCASLVNIVNNQHGHAVRYWEPFNEMDGGTYSGSSDMVQLASIFRSCYTAMKAQDANIKIVGGAWRQPWDADIDDFLDNLGTAYLDVWSHHEYGGGSQTNVQELYNRTHLEWGISHMRTKLNNKGYTNVPVWLDEWNIYWTYDADGYPNMSNHVSAVYDALVYKYIAEQGIAGAVFSWNAADGRYGKVEPDYSGLRPGGRLLKLFGSLAHGQVLSTTSGNDTQIQGFAVRNTANNTLMIAVINRHSGSVNVNLSASGWTPSSDVVTRYVISSAGYSSSTVSWASAVVGTSISTPASSVTIFVSQATGTGGGSTAPLGSTVALKANVNGKYVELVSASGNKLKAQASSSTAATCQFQVVDAGGVLVALRCVANNKFVAAENSGAADLVANRDTYGAWEKYEWTSNSDGTIALKAAVNNKYVVAENFGNNFLIANRSGIGSWEKFYAEVIGAGNDEAIAVSGPSAVEAGGTYTISVDYEASTNRNVSVYLFNTSVWNTHGSGTVSVSAGAGTVSVPVTVANPAVGTDYQWTAKVEEQGTYLALDEATQWVEVVDLPSDDAQSLSGPTSVQAGGTYAITVNYEATTSRRVSVYLFNTSVWNTHGSASTTVSAGSGQVTLSLTVANPAVGTDYQWTAKVEDLSTGNALDEVAQWCQVVAGASGGSTYHFYSETGNEFGSEGGSIGSYAFTATTQSSGAPEGSQYLRLAPNNHYASYRFELPASSNKSAWANASLQLQVRTSADFDLIMEQGNGVSRTLSLSNYISKSGAWETATIPLADFGADLSQFRKLSVYRTWNGAVSIDLDHLRITGIAAARHAQAHTPGPLTAQLLAYPNPTQALLTVKYPNEESFTAYLYDANGLLRMSWDGAHTPQVDLGHLPSGIYVLKVLAASGIATRKIILD